MGLGGLMPVRNRLVTMLKRVLYPVRVGLGRFIILPERLSISDSIAYKAASLVATEKINGDYLEFGSYRGTSFILAYNTKRLNSCLEISAGVGHGRRSKIVRIARQFGMRCAFLHLTRLEACHLLLTDGTIIIFDDWYCFRGNPKFGEQRACRQWLGENEELQLSEYRKEGPWRNSFIVNRR